MHLTKTESDAPKKTIIIPNKALSILSSFLYRFLLSQLLAFYKILSSSLYLNTFWIFFPNKVISPFNK